MTDSCFISAQGPRFDGSPASLLAAIEESLASTRQRFLSLRDNPELPTFENTAVPFDTLFEEASELARLFAVRREAAFNDEVSEAYERYQQAFDRVSKDIFQDRTMATRFLEVYQNRDVLPLDAEDKWFLENLFADFAESGAFLPGEDQARLREIDTALISAASRFEDNLNRGAMQQAILFTDPADMAGIPADKVQSFAEQARAVGKEGWLFVPERLMVDELLAVAESRNFRQKILESLNRIGTQEPSDNTDIILEINRLRHERAGLLGYDSHAACALSRTMAGSLERVEELFDRSMALLVPQFEKDMKELGRWAREQGGPDALEPWDVPFWTAQYKSAHFAYDETDLSRYLELESVLDGYFSHTGKLFGVEFVQSQQYPTWHEDVRTYDVVRSGTGDHVGVLYVDLFARPDSKIGGAWMEDLASGAGAAPRSVTMNLNLAKPEPGEAALISPDQVLTLFHEGGHAMNGLTGTSGKYRSRRGTGNSSDFLEIHSMLQENWAFEPEVLATYARHVDTGARVPDKLIEARQRASSFMASLDALRLIQNSRRDLAIHARALRPGEGPADIETSVALGSPYDAHLRAYPLTRFSHLFSDGLSQYASGYYGYYWSGVQEAAAFSAFKGKGLYDPALSEKLRAFYAAGASLESNEAFEAFTGKAAGDPSAFFKRLGIETSPPSPPRAVPPAPPPPMPA